MDVKNLVDLFAIVSGLDEGQAKVCIYYAVATHKLRYFSRFPILEVIGPFGTGKSAILDLMAVLCYKPRMVGCDGLTDAALRDELARSVDATFIGEEGDAFKDPKAAEALLGARYSRSTSNIVVKRLSEKGWTQREMKIFGATVVHHRRSFLDQAVQSRAISIRTRFREVDFVKLTEMNGIDIALPDIPIVDPLKGVLPGVNPWLVARTLRKLGLKVARIGGTNWVYPTEETLKKAAQQIGYEDQALG